MNTVTNIKWQKINRSRDAANELELSQVETRRALFVLLRKLDLIKEDPVGAQLDKEDLRRLKSALRQESIALHQLERMAQQFLDF